MTKRFVKREFMPPVWSCKFYEPDRSISHLIMSRWSLAHNELWIRVSDSNIKDRIVKQHNKLNNIEKLN